MSDNNPIYSSDNQDDVRDNEVTDGGTVLYEDEDLVVITKEEMD